MELEDEGKLKRWSNMSGTYRCPAASAEQAELPMECFFAVHPSPGAHAAIPADCVLTSSRVILKPVSTYGLPDGHMPAAPPVPSGDSETPGLLTTQQKPSAA